LDMLWLLCSGETLQRKCVLVAEIAFYILCDDVFSRGRTEGATFDGGVPGTLKEFYFEGLEHVSLPLVEWNVAVNVVHLRQVESNVVELMRQAVDMRVQREEVRRHLAA